MSPSPRTDESAMDTDFGSKVVAYAKNFCLLIKCVGKEDELAQMSKIDAPHRVAAAEEVARA